MKIFIYQIDKNLTQNQSKVDLSQLVNVGATFSSTLQEVINDIHSFENKLIHLFEGSKDKNQDQNQEVNKEFKNAEKGSSLEAKPLPSHEEPKISHDQSHVSSGSHTPPEIVNHANVWHALSHEPISYLIGTESGGSIDLASLQNLPPDFKPLPGTEITEQEALEDIYEMVGDHHYDETYTPWTHFSIPESVPQILSLGSFAQGEIYHFEQVIIENKELFEFFNPIPCSEELKANPDYASVSESGLEQGSAPNPNTRTATGNVLTNDLITEPVEICQVKVNNVLVTPDPVTGIVDVSNAVGEIIFYTKAQPGHAMGAFEYDLHYYDDSSNPPAVDEQPQTLTYTLCELDGENCSSTATLTVSLGDDAPKAVDDDEQCVEESTNPNAPNSISGNVFDNDIPGADGPIKIYSFEYNANVNGVNTLVTEYMGNNMSETVTTFYGGTLTVNSDGSWSYTAAIAGSNPNTPPFNDNFKYTEIDAEEHKSSATQPICVEQQEVPPTNPCDFLDPTPSEVPPPPIHYNYTPTVFTDDTNPNDGTISLREAIIAANTDVNSTSVIHLTQGTYQLTIAPSKSDDQYSGDLNVLKNLIIQGDGENNTIIDANAIDRIFNVNPGVTLTLRDLTIEDGAVKSADGGGILNNGNLNLYNVTIVNNTVTGGDGAGIASHGTGNLVLINSTVENNDGNKNSSGGGIYSDSTGNIAITSSNIGFNQSDRDGGGITILNSSNAQIENSLIHENTTVSGGGLGGDDGGGIYVENSNLTINHSTIGCNQSGEGGGIFAVEQNQEITSVTILNSSIVHNLADGGGGSGSGSGGGINAFGATFQITNSTISENGSSGSTGRGGAIFLDNGSNFTIDNSTIVNNSAASNGNTGAIDSNTNKDTITLTSTIVAQNDTDTTFDSNIADDHDLSGKGFVSGGHNLIGNYTNGNSDFSPTASDIIGVDPKLSPLQDNGGPTFTHAVLAGSPAIDSGSNPLGLTTDQRGEPRPDGTETTPDIGAYESQNLGPIILDLYDQGINLVAPSKPLLFDANNDGAKDQMLGWAGPMDAFLVYNSQSNSHLLTGKNISFTSYSPFATTDLQGLAAFDTNHNGMLDSKDAAYKNFGVWQDVNQNGKVDKGEYLTLEKVGITGIGLSSNGHVEFVGNNTIYGEGTFTTKDGKTHGLADVALGYLANSQANSSHAHVDASANSFTAVPPPSINHLPELASEHPHFHHS